VSIESLANTLQFLDIDYGSFEINAINNEAIFTSSEGGPRTITLSDGTYDGDGLATELATQLNADATLTGGSITFAVTYSSTTSKFTIDATAGNIIAYTHTGSDAGFTLGFDQDHSASQTITSDNAANDPTAIVSSILTSTEEFVSSWCRRTFESTSYTLERYSGRGYNIINLNNYPVTAVDRVAIGTRNAITVTNTNTGTSASATVTSTGLRLVLDGTADETVLWATYATIATVVAAVNALGSGWSASVTNTTYSSFKSSDLITQYGTSCINGRYVYLSIPNEAEYDIEVDLDNGQILYNAGFYKGFNNVFVDYTAGYSDSNMPEDLKLAVKIIVQYIYQQVKEGTFGVDLHNIGASGSTGARVVFEKGFIIPKEAERILSWYKRRLV